MNVVGYVAPGFEGLFDEFRTVLAEGTAGGAAFAAVVEGVTVVDLWGGIADPARGAPWVERTPAVVFSRTKGVCAVAMLLLLERGALELDAPVARYWPAFAAHGKD